MYLRPPPQIRYYLDEFSGHCCDILLGFTLPIRWKYFSWAMDEIHLLALKSYLISWRLIILKWWLYIHIFILSTFKKIDGRIMFGLIPTFQKSLHVNFLKFFPQITIIGRSQACSRTTNTQEAGLVLRSGTSHKVLMGPFLITLAVFLVQKVHRNCRNHQHFKIIYQFWLLG